VPVRVEAAAAYGSGAVDYDGFGIGAHIGEGRGGTTSCHCRPHNTVTPHPPSMREAREVGGPTSLSVCRSRKSWIPFTFALLSRAQPGITIEMMCMTFSPGWGPKRHAIAVLKISNEYPPPLETTSTCRQRGYSRAHPCTHKTEHPVRLPQRRGGARQVSCSRVLTVGPPFPGPLCPSGMWTTARRHSCGGSLRHDPRSLDLPRTWRELH